MVEELRKLVLEHLASGPGLVALVISDKDGVPILQASTDHSPNVEVCLRHQFLSSHSLINEASKKINFQEMKKSLM